MLKKEYEKRRRVLADLLWAWDPVGIGDLRSDIPEEYDELVEGFLYRFSRGATGDQMSSWIRRELINHWSASYSAQVTDEFVRDAILMLEAPS